MELWYTEQHADSVRFSIKINRQLFSGKSEFQQIDVLSSDEFGVFLLGQRGGETVGVMLICAKDQLLLERRLRSYGGYSVPVS